jgi:hypothetical protein
MREMVHQRDKKWQILGRDALLVEGQDEIAALGGQQVIRILDALGDALARQHLTEIVKRHECAQLVIADFRVDCHPPGAPFHRPASQLVRVASLA